VIGREVCAFEHRRDLELAWSHLVVPGLGRNAKFEQLPLGVHHEAQHPLGHGTEVMVVELLTLGRLRAEQSTAGVDEIRACEEEVPVDKEVLLFRSAERHHLLELLVAE
jgi:hypothetical protein